MVASMPSSGSVLGPGAGFMLGVNLFNMILAATVLSLGVADYLAAVWPGVSPVGAALAALAVGTGLGILNIPLQRRGDGGVSRRGDGGAGPGSRWARPSGAVRWWL